MLAACTAAQQRQISNCDQTYSSQTVRSPRSL